MWLSTNTFPLIHRGGGASKIQFTELDIPRALASYAPSLKLLGGLFRPSQEMVNAIRKEIAEASNKDPPFKPFILPKLSHKPWMPDTADRNLAMTNWKSYSKGRKTTIPLEMSIQSFLLFQLRFVFAADLCMAWSPFGGLAPQLSHLSIVLNLSVTESVGVAMLYHSALMTKLSEKARQRNTNEDEFIQLLSSEQFEFRERAKRDVAASTKAKEKATPVPNRPQRQSEEGNRSRKKGKYSCQEGAPP